MSRGKFSEECRPVLPVVVGARSRSTAPRTEENKSGEREKAERRAWLPAEEMNEKDLDIVDPEHKFIFTSSQLK